MMTPEDLERERRKSAEALSQVTEAAHGVDVVRTPQSVLGPTEPVRTAEGDPPPPPPASAWNPPAPPDLGPVNASYETSRDRSSDLSSPLRRRCQGRRAQARFNSDQVKLDNALVSWTAAHFTATHTHYDAAIARMQKRMDDIDTRHRELERELVRHVHDMARRIDVVLGEGEKGRVSHEAALRSLRERLRTLEEKLR
jgi:hypothetical protein